MNSARQNLPSVRACVLVNWRGVCVMNKSILVNSLLNKAGLGSVSVDSIIAAQLESVVM